MRRKVLFTRYYIRAARSKRTKTEKRSVSSLGLKASLFERKLISVSRLLLAPVLIPLERRLRGI